MPPFETENQVHLKSTMRQIYDGVSLLPGDKFPNPVPEHVAKGLLAHRYAVIDDDLEVEARKRKGVVETKVIKEPDSKESTEPDSKESEADQQRRRKGRYSRRDLRAEDEDAKVITADDTTSSPAEPNG